MPRSFFAPEEGQDPAQAQIQPPNMLQAVLPQNPPQQTQQPTMGSGLGLLQYLQNSRDRREERAERTEDRAFSRSLAEEDQAMQRTRFAQDQEDRAFSRSLTEEDQAMQREGLDMRREEFARNMRALDDQDRELELGRQRDAARQRISQRRFEDENNPLADERQINDAAMLALAEDAKSGRWGETFDKMDAGYRELAGKRSRSVLDQLDEDLAMLPTGEQEAIRGALAQQAQRQADALAERYSQARGRIVEGLQMGQALRADAAERAEAPLRMQTLEIQAKRAFDESPRGFEVQAKMGNLGPVPQLALSAADDEERKAFLDSGENGTWVRELATRLSPEDAARIANGDYSNAYRSAELGNDFRIQASPTFMADDFANLLANPVVKLPSKPSKNPANPYGAMQDNLGPARGRKVPLDKDGRFYAVVEADSANGELLYERVAKPATDSSGKRPGPAFLTSRIKESFFGAGDDTKDFQTGPTSDQNYAADLEALQEFWGGTTIQVYENVGGKPSVVEKIADPLGSGRQQMNSLLERLGMLEMVPGSTRGKTVPDPETGQMRVVKPLGFAEWRNRVEPLARSLRRSTLGPLDKSVRAVIAETPGADKALNLEKNGPEWVAHLSAMLLGGQESSWLQQKLAEGVSMPEAMAAFEDEMIRPAIHQWIEEDKKRASSVSSQWTELRSQGKGREDQAMRAYRALDRSALAPHLAQIKMGLETSAPDGHIYWKESRGAPGNVSPVEFGVQDYAAREWNRWGTSMPDWWDQRFATELDMLDMAHTYARIRTRLYADGTGEDAIYRAFDELGKSGAFSDAIQGNQKLNLLDTRMYALKKYAARHRETVERDPILLGMMRFFNVPF